jgi:hypothetical protein
VIATTAGWYTANAPHTAAKLLQNCCKTAVVSSRWKTGAEKHASFSEREYTTNAPHTAAKLLQNCCKTALVEWLGGGPS